jgi:predicted AlkP superfamily pyrophosphatase or phosphodiesterase
VVGRVVRAGRALRLAALLVVLLAGPARAESPLVIVLSWDGTRHDYPDRGPAPALERMAREGVRAGRLVPVFPSQTFPNHVALATGARTARHGILGNRFRDRVRGLFDYSNDASWIEAEPLWVAAERQGRKAALFFWVGSETDWRGTGATYRKAPFDEAIPESVKVDQILAWLSLPEGERPALVMAWWHGCDSEGHRRGPDHASIGEKLRAQDAELGRLLAGLDARQAWSYTTLLVVSDHGMTRLEKGVDVSQALRERGIDAQVQASTAVADVFLADPARADEVVVALASVPGVRAYTREALPDRLAYRHPTRTGDVVALTDPPHAFANSRTWNALVARARLALGGSVGGHGYDPEHPDMGGIFFALGRGVPKGLSLERVEAVDVAPTVARLLGIEPPAQAEGRPLPGIGEPAPGPSLSSAPPAR